MKLLSVTVWQVNLDSYKIPDNGAVFYANNGCDIDDDGSGTWRTYRGCGNDHNSYHCIYPIDMWCQLITTFTLYNYNYLSQNQSSETLWLSVTGKCDQIWSKVVTLSTRWPYSCLLCTLPFLPKSTIRIAITYIDYTVVLPVNSPRHDWCVSLGFIQIFPLQWQYKWVLFTDV